MPNTTDFCPYVGLQPYTSNEREFFFGREGDIRTIASNLFAAPLTILYGASGVGKTSVLLAGVVPLLKTKPRTAVTVFAKWQVLGAVQVFKLQCLKAVQDAHGEALNLDVNRPLDDLLKSAADAFKSSILIILDQFEEYFLYNLQSASGGSFDGELARAINRKDVDANFLIALREDGLAKLDRFRARIPHLLGNSLRVRHLTLAAASDAICKPLAVYKAKFPQSDAPSEIEPKLVNDILAQVQHGKISLGRYSGIGEAPADSGAEQIETPFLQLVLTRLWDRERQQHSTVLRASTLAELGGAQQIARTHLDDIMRGLQPRQLEVCARFFDRLVTPSGGKVAYSLEDLTKFADTLAPEVPKVLEVLSQARILRTVAPEAGQSSSLRYEIFHDVLASAILDWQSRFTQQQKRAEEERLARAEVDKNMKELEQQNRAAREKLKYTRRVWRLSVAIVIMLIGWLIWARNTQKKIATANLNWQNAQIENSNALYLDHILITNLQYQLGQSQDVIFESSNRTKVSAYFANIAKATNVINSAAVNSARQRSNAFNATRQAAKSQSYVPRN